MIIFTIICDVIIYNIDKVIIFINYNNIFVSYVYDCLFNVNIKNIKIYTIKV